MLPDRVSNPGPLTYESDALSIALRGTATCNRLTSSGSATQIPYRKQDKQKNNEKCITGEFIFLLFFSFFFLYFIFLHFLRSRET